jgi:hypothetical protein
MAPRVRMVSGYRSIVALTAEAAADVKENAMAGYAPVGTHYDLMPIPPVEEHCVSVPAGPIRFVVESRQLTEETAREASAEIAAHIEGRENQAEDHGASLHVYGAEDGLEHLRFDCFENEPHYHYINNAEGGMVIVRLDQCAEGDPIAWTLTRLRERLPQMLEFAGVPALGAAVRDDYETVRSAGETVADLLVKAHVTAIEEHALSAEAG